MHCTETAKEYRGKFNIERINLLSMDRLSKKVYGKLESNNFYYFYLTVTWISKQEHHFHTKLDMELQ